jgi:site-specific DNA-cytosine methylase
VEAGGVRVLVACEYSGAVRRAFRERGHDAWSCDLLPADDASEFHIIGDVREQIGSRLVPWDAMIAFPPCTDLAVSGARWFPQKRADGRQGAAIDFFMLLANADIPRIALENPIGIMSTAWRKPDQIVHPWQFGHGEVKATCLWLKGFKPLRPTKIVGGRYARVHRLPPSEDRWKLRSTTYAGIASAMAEQWGE